MGKIFREGQPNFPSKYELPRRLEEIRKLINNDDKVSQVNIKFVEAAFQLMQDCDLITEDNLNALASANYCYNVSSEFRFPFLPTEGAVRRTINDFDVGDDKGFKRFYDGTDRKVLLANEQSYLLSNDWYNSKGINPHNKEAFYRWLKQRAEKACSKHWNFGYSSETTFKPTPRPDLQTVLKSLEDLHKKVDEIANKFGDLNKDVIQIVDKAVALNKDVVEVKKEIKALNELLK